MRIACATDYDLRDIRRGSGSFHCLAKEMERQGHVIHYLGPLEEIDSPVATRIFKRLAVRSGKRYLSRQDPFAGRRLGRAVERKLRGLDFDVLLTKDYTIAAYTRSPRPTVLHIDYVLPLDYRANTHPKLANLSPLCIFWCHHITRRALRRVALAFFYAQWAYDEALKYRAISKEQMGVVPSGANISPPTREIILARSFQKNVDERSLRLLFVGKVWNDKGGDTALDAVTELNRRGICATIDVVGSKPDYPVDERVVMLHGLLDKSVSRERERLSSLYVAADALIHPSPGEGLVNVALEAAAYGLPVLGYEVRGVADAVKNGVTGLLLSPGASGRAFADAVEQWFRNPACYDAMSRQARACYESTFNWETAAQRLITQIQRHLAKRPILASL